MNRRVALLAGAAVCIFILGILARPFMSALVSRVRGTGLLPTENGKPVDPAGYARKSAQYAAMNPTRNIVFLGDSRIEWADWSELLNRADISNRGIAGDTMTGVVRRMRTSVPTDEVVCVIQAGVNDVLQGTSSDPIVARYRELAQYLLKEKNARVILTSIIPVAEERPALNATIAQCNQQLSQLAATTGMEWVDLNTTLAPRGYLSSEYSDDGVHLNAKGYAQVCRVLGPILPNEQ